MAQFTLGDNLQVWLEQNAQLPETGCHQEKSVRKNNENSDSRVCVLFMLVGCTPRIEVAAPKEPITLI